MNKALIIVDVQQDFCHGGSLAVPDGDAVVAPLNMLSNFARQNGWIIIASRDWHPPVTPHFKTYGGLWPVHCVADTKGAQFHNNLDVTNAVIVSKGMSNRDDYSAFDGFIDNHIMLGHFLNGKDVKEVFVGGLATDYCVKETVIAACRTGFRTYFLQDASRAVKPEDDINTIKEMTKLGAIVTTTNEVING